MYVFTQQLLYKCHCYTRQLHKLLTIIVYINANNLGSNTWVFKPWVATQNWVASTPSKVARLVLGRNACLGSPTYTSKLYKRRDQVIRCTYFTKFAKFAIIMFFHDYYEALKS